jgi:iron complex outermembrane receptor protein
MNVFIEDKTSEYSTVGYKSVAAYDYKSGNMSFNYLSDDIKLVFGSSYFDGSRHTVADFASTNEVTKDNFAGFIKADYLLNSHNFTAGLRAERVSYSYSDVTGVDLTQDDILNAYELGYNYKIDDSEAVFASYAHAFQAPDIDKFFATSYPAPTFTPVIDFNGFLNPMKSDTYNLGYKNFTEHNKFKATAFYIKLHDEIHYNPVTFANTNLDRSSKLGFELYDKYLILDNLYLSANYTYVDARVEEDAGLGVKDTVLPGVSKHNISTSIGYAPTQESKLILSHTYRSQAYALNDFSNNFSQEQDNYNATDISASYAFEHLEVFAKIQNLFDKNNGLWVQDDAIYPINFQRAFQVGLSGSF